MTAYQGWTPEVPYTEQAANLAERLRDASGYASAELICANLLDIHQDIDEAYLRELRYIVQQCEWERRNWQAVVA